MSTLVAETEPSSVRKPVEFVRHDVTERLEEWNRVTAAMKGEDAVKKLGAQILPMPNPEDTSKANQLRFDAYLRRAVFYPVSSRTARGLVGYAFSTAPRTELPDELAKLTKNIDSSGVTLDQQAQKTLRRVLCHGNCGLFVDYPSVASTTKKDAAEGRVLPRIIMYEPECITNWLTREENGVQVLQFVVLKEGYYEVGPDDFTVELKTQYRELRLTEQGYEVRIHRKLATGFEVTETFQPTMHNGKRFDYIPFTFVGSESNDAVLDDAPLLDLVNLNLAHYRNSADHEEAAFICGQPTPVVSGMTEDWLNKVLSGVLTLGSRAAVPLPPNCTAELLQADPNTLPGEAMKHKETQMLALGARLIESTATVQRTATESDHEHTSDISVLLTCATNTVDAYVVALEFAADFVGADKKKIRYTLGETLTQREVTPELANALILEWQAGLISYSEARLVLKRGGVAYMDDEKARKEAEGDKLAQRPAEQALKAKQAAKKSSDKPSKDPLKNKKA